ncbi:BppU family phage baseplate upper protein [Laedolimicola ammoniilytica]|uniref:Phage baseplate upper protein n=1 Tax=Laedolimicola ammoniilytica TaxID=2981771 RepID=A0ABT2RYD3_9FIRM|nr:BppU family phage baseplate upper protein [Laedolimicola ammoniilytica]MCU6697283.1 phage baseplate upper protein [Laedolimicola ammoniilytica]SCI18372.1 Uncharacterised protein [uncultured Clostridium sp.]
MKTYYDITVDLYDLYPLKKIEAQQNNIGRGARITLTAGGLVLGLDGESVTMWAKKPDGTVSYLSCSVVDGKIQADFTSQMLAVPGDVQVELRLVNGEENITTPIFSVHVRKSNIDDSAAESTNEFTALASMVAEVNEMKKTALKGDPGEAATLEIGTVEASEPGSAPSVTNSGTAQEAILNFILPRGQTGPEGPAGQTQIHFSAAAEFPAAGNSTMLYVDNTVSPAIIYTWTGNAYVQASADISTVMAMLATPYDPDQDYTAGQYVTYNKQYWKFTATKSAGAWDVSKAVATNVGTELSSVNANNDIKSIQLYLGYCVVYKRNGIVTIVGDSSDYQLEAGKYIALTTLPEGYRPPKTMYIPVNNLGGTTAIFGRVESNGIISLYATGVTSYWAYSFSFVQMY